MAVSSSATHLALALARPDATVDVFALPSLSRTSLPPPALRGAPSALLLTSSVPPVPLLGSSTGDLYLAATPLPALPGGVTALASGGKHLLAAGGAARELLLLRGSDGKLIARSELLAEHRAAVTALALSEDASMAVVCSQAVTLVDPRSGSVLRRFAGHTGPVSAAALLPGAGRLITASGRDRFVSVWDVHMGGEPQPRDSAVKRRRKSKSALSPAVATLIAPESGVLGLNVDTHETSGASVVALLASGNVAVWRNWTEKGSGKKGSECSFVIRNAPQGGKAAPVFAAVFGEVGVLTVMYGSALRPSVWSIKLCDVEGEEVMLPPCETDVLVKKAVREGKGKIDLVKKTAAAGVSSAPAMPRKEKRKANGLVFVGEDEREEGESDEERVNAEEEDDDDEPSIQQKLIALGISKDGAQVPAGQNFPTPGSKKGVLGSRVNVLMQAVRSQDSALFDETIDRMRDTKLIKTTVERLPQSIAAGDFLDMLVDRLRRYPTKAENLVRWIREVLLEHTGALISQQKSKALVALIEIVNERTQALEGLSRLQGRLELVVARADKLKRAGARVKTSDAVPRALYEEEEGSADEEEDSSDEGSEESGSEAGSEDVEDETGDFGSESSSGEEESDEEMEDVADRGPAETEKGASNLEHTIKLNGNHIAHDGDEESSESESSDDGD